MSNKVMKKILFYVDVRFVSPVSVSSGNVEMTDGDVLRDFEGKPFISGSSLAGAMRSYLNFDKNQKCIFGCADGKADFGKMSSLYLSDLTFKDEVKIVVRDGVGLSEGKTAMTEKKFDMEAIDSGAKGSFIMELIIREQDNEETMLSQLYQALGGIAKGEIHLGNKKTRGYGEMELVAVRSKEYHAKNIFQYKDAYNLEKVYEELEDCKAECIKHAVSGSRYMCMKVPLKLAGGISIRQYSSKKGEPDMVHITAHGEPVIPGTSFAGAIRSRMKEILQVILKECSTEKIEKLIEEMWGYVRGNDARKSNIVIAESIIENAASVRTVRTGVSRFESAAKKRGLREERIYAKGNLVLKINIAKDIPADWMIGLLLLAIKDLQKGYLPVGGQTSVGRGVFEANGDVTIDDKTVDENTYFQKFQVKMEEGLVC